MRTTITDKIVKFKAYVKQTSIETNITHITFTTIMSQAIGNFYSIICYLVPFKNIMLFRGVNYFLQYLITMSVSFMYVNKYYQKTKVKQ